MSIVFDDPSTTSTRSRKTTTFTISEEDPDPSVIKRNRSGSQSVEFTSQSLDTVKLGKVQSGIKRKIVEEENKGDGGIIIFPWNHRYRYWWAITVVCAIGTVLTETFAVAFEPPGDYMTGDFLSVIEYIFVAVFLIDIFVNFHLVYYGVNDHLITDKREIAIHYLKTHFFIDLAGIFPFYFIALLISGHRSGDANSQLSLLRLIKLVRIHRVASLFAELQYNPNVSLMWLTLIRNFGFAFFWSHLSACIFFFIAREYNFHPDKTWIGGSVDSMSPLERYITSLYYSVVT